MRKNLLYSFSLKMFCATLIARFLFCTKQPESQFSISANEPVGQLGLNNLNHILANKIGNSFFSDGFLHKNAASVFFKVLKRPREKFSQQVERVIVIFQQQIIFFDLSFYHFSTKTFVTCVNRN